jgi:hypothetical protein
MPTLTFRGQARKDRDHEKDSSPRGSQQVGSRSYRTNF